MGYLDVVWMNDLILLERVDIGLKMIDKHNIAMTRYL